MAYKNDGQIETVISNDGTEYNFEYDKFGKLLSVSMNNIIISSFEYSDEVDSINTELITKKIYKNDNYYEFIYDDKKRLKSILFNGETKVIYEYDSKFVVINF